MFSRPFAWCVDSGKKEWSSVNLGERYLIYSFEVDGYSVDVPDFPSDQYLSKTFEIDYSLDRILWASYEGGRVSNYFVSKQVKY